MASLLLITSGQMTSMVRQGCPEVTPEEAQVLWLEYWKLETQLHWSFWLLPNFQKSSENTLKMLDKEYINVNHTLIYGSKKCPKVRSTFLDLQPDCPVHYVIENDPDRIPVNIVHVRCSCKHCRHSKSDERGCTPVYTYTKVMRRMADCKFAPVLEAVPVACTCSSKIKFIFVDK